MNLLHPIRSILVSLLLLVYLGLGAQNSHTNLATQLCQSGEFKKAIDEADLAINDPAEKDDFYTWYARGFVYKEYFKNFEMQDIKSPARIKAIESFLKSRAMAIATAEDLKNHDLALTFLAKTYINHALTYYASSSTPKDEEGDALVENACQVLAVLGKNADCQTYRRDYLEVKANYYVNLAIANPDDSALREKALSLIEKVIADDPSDCASQYNHLVIMCNQMVRLNRTRTDGDYEELIRMTNRARKSWDAIPASCKQHPEHQESFKKANEIIIQIETSLKPSGK